MSISDRERQKYADIWSLPAYSESSPGAHWVEAFEQIVGPRRGARIWDIGCGAGAASIRLAERGYTPHCFDLTDVPSRPREFPFQQGSIFTSPPRAIADHVFCCDVMEHLPTEYVALAIANMLSVAPSLFLSISFEPDHFGTFIDQPLHLTVKPFTWWRDLLAELADVIDARDLMGEGIFHIRRRH